MMENMDILKKIRVLYVEDDDDTREFGSIFLSEYFGEIITAANGEEGLQKFRDNDIDLVITDINMPGKDGLQLSREIKALDHSTIILALSAHSHKDYLVDSIKVGIDDYIFNPLTAENFEEYLSHVLGRLNFHKVRADYIEKLENEIEIQKKRLEHKEKLLAQKTRMAYYDQLTGLCNRHCFHEKFNAIRKGRETGLILIDIDNFKKINDTYGHDVGDVVLKSFASIITQSIRDIDWASRWGGEEFSIILAGSDIDETLNVAERIRERIENFDFETVGRVTASFGVTVCRPDDTLETAMKRSDEALYNAKYHGKNRVYIG
jgi:diguanylate cyclase (GGDEF)-like protein